MLIVGVLMLGPEIIWILGGSKYVGAEACLPPLLTSCVFQLVYRMYVNIEFYEKKTVGVGIATMMAAGINIILNFLLIPLDLEHGYVIASYTTLIGYMILFVLHYYMVKRIGMSHVYDTKYIIIVLIGSLSVAFLLNLLYPHHILVLIYAFAVLYFAYKNRSIILDIIKKRKQLQFD